MRSKKQISMSGEMLNSGSSSSRFSARRCLAMGSGFLATLTLSGPETHENDLVYSRGRGRTNDPANIGEVNLAICPEVQAGLLALEVPLLLFLLDEIHQVLVVNEDLLAIRSSETALPGVLIAVNVDHDTTHLVVLLLRVTRNRHLHPLIHLHDNEGSVDDKEDQHDKNDVQHRRDIDLAFFILFSNSSSHVNYSLMVN